jgi:putative membrane protein
MHIMLSTVAAMTAQHVGYWGGGAPFWPFFIIFPLMFLLVVGLIISLVVRRRRFGAYGPSWAQAHTPGARSAEQTLAERFAKGDIDETEYRARLEVLRANRPEM